MRYSKKHYMFLALAPYSEIIYIIAIVLIWIYIACGIIGRSRANRELSSYSEYNATQVKIFQISEQKVVSTRTCYLKFSSFRQKLFSKKNTFFWLDFFEIRKVEFVISYEKITRQEYFLNLPNRAPPRF